MKVVLINTKLPGGAYVACQRLTQALPKAGVDATMVEIERKRWNFLWERLCIFIANRFSKKNLFAVSIANTGVDISKLKVVQEADIIHLHWINQGGLSLHNIVQLQSLGKPIVWTCHDMWPFTGICHHANDCDQYQQQCEHCPKIHSELAHRVFLKKEQLYFHITLVGVSQWIANLAQQSTLGHLCQVTTIPNPIDLQTYYPIDPIEARQQLGLPFDRPLVLFGSMNIADKQKGIDYLLQADKLIDKNFDYIVIGAKGLGYADQLSHPVHCLGYIKDDDQKRLIYSAATLFVTPSLAETLPTMIMEAMACGTPCVGFNIGGIPEMIGHKQNGYIAKHKDAQDFADGIKWCLDNEQKLIPHTVTKVTNTYSETVVTKQMIQLYNNLLNAHPKAER